jgi:hypothetical protein
MSAGVTEELAGFRVPDDGANGDVVHNVGMYFTDRGIEELEQRRGDQEVTLAWLAARLRDFVDLNPEFETPVERLATWLARLDDDDDLSDELGDEA